jgi:transcriptional regulator with XRE-family HTH domain
MTTTQTTQTPEATVTEITAAPSAAKAAPKPKAEPIKITAAKGGTQVVAPKPGKIAAAIKATGQSISQIARAHGQNPSQLRRLSLDAVAKVDLPRAQSIAQALGADLADLFDAPVDKAKAGNGKAATPKAATTPAAPKAPATRKPAITRKPASRAARGAAQAKADRAGK